MASELALNHIAQDTLMVTGTSQPLPVPRATDGKGHYKTNADGTPMFLFPRHALIYVGGQPVRWRADGIAPDSGPGMGMYQAAGSYINWTDPLGDFAGIISRVHFVKAEDATGNPVLEISYFA